MTRKVQIVRWWLLAILAVAWACLYGDPTLGIVPIAFFTGQAGCFCCAVACVGCSGDAPNQIQVDIAGLTNGVCNNCVAFNATWVVTRASTECISGGSVPDTLCYWSFTSGSPSICPNLGGPAGVCVQLLADDDPILRASLHMTGQSTSQATFEDTTGIHDCEAYSAHNIPLVLLPGGCGGAATCEITAL